MDARKERIGEHAASNPLAWATSRLGPVPADRWTRLEWQQRAAAIGAYRELSGYSDPADPIGPEPAAAARTSGPPGTRPWPPSAPPTAPMFAACPTAGCCTCATPTRSRPPGHPRYVGDELRQARAAAWDAHLAGLRATAEAVAALHRGNHQDAAAQHELTVGYQALEQAYRQRETVFAPDDGRSRRLGQGHPSPAPACRRRRRRAAPPPPRPALRPAALRPNPSR